MPTEMDAVRDMVKERGLLRPRDLEAEGLPPRYLRRLHERGELERIGRGSTRIRMRRLPPTTAWPLRPSGTPTWWCACSPPSSTTS